MNNSDLLKELRIDRSAPPPVASRRPLWIALAVAAGVVVLALAGWALLGRDDAAVVIVGRDVADGQRRIGEAAVEDQRGDAGVFRALDDRDHPFAVDGREADAVDLVVDEPGTA